MPTSTLAHTELLELEKPSTHGATSSHRPKTTLLHSGPTAGFAIAKMAATTIAAPKNTAFQVLALPLSNASQGVTQRKRPNNRFTLSGQELMRGLASLVFVSMIVLRDWWEPVPGKRNGDVRSLQRRHPQVRHWCVSPEDSRRSAMRCLSGNNRCWNTDAAPTRAAPFHLGT